MLHVVPSDSGPPALAELLAACRLQERVAQRRLYGQFYGYAMSICLRYARNRDQAMEAANDGFLKVFRDVSRFDAARHPEDVLGSFRGWLKRIMIHTAIDHYRANERHQHQQELDDVTLNHADSGPTPLDALSYDELLALVQRLPPAYRAVFNLAVIDGFGHEEIAEQLHISVGTSKSNLFKARAHLRTMLAQCTTSEKARYVVG
ncbi:sigma-70 family RNA polymerase sigma factor [Hymenobacter sp. BT770]|jgi:RNA polymerase sigma-70 factor (ECF subfamily)|uniref:RNA polymerase sigma factor n=1 Tax=Hymenobacter sp. BT770 TaxID=2886942 RepID=UPI001D1051E6|nr:sigma-70 family RNA polymerase sigma factor [Hymenobacter sp. BT770]MCC3151800.1 sigma-70 family RNA polymerase sigma factor [Hymenobacter sp. BT770]MDO3413578.1 sigma-70 family RNA polymerase sigma factor [Hymenobacter sp. BT770]